MTNKERVKECYELIDAVRRDVMDELFEKGKVSPVRDWAYENLVERLADILFENNPELIEKITNGK